MKEQELYEFIKALSEFEDNEDSISFDNCVDELEKRLAPNTFISKKVYYYKVQGKLVDFEDDDLVYIPQEGFRTDSSVIPEDYYTKKCIVEIAENDYEEAEELFRELDGLHPEATYDSILNLRDFEDDHAYYFGDGDE